VIAPVLLFAVVTLVAIGVGAASATAPVVVSGAVAAAVLVVVLWQRPRAALVVWLLSLVMMPIWVGVSWFAYVPIQSLIAVGAIIAIAGSVGFDPTKFDIYFGVFLLLALAAVLLAGSNQGIWMEFALQWGLSYLVARVIVPATGITFAVNAIAVIFALVGGLALIELLFTWHPYVGLKVDSQQYQTWAEIQTREGLDRSEWAFGHSIALGGSLALSIPFIVGSTFGRSAKALMLGVALAGVVTSASRAALVAALVTLTLCYLAYLTKQWVRVAIAVIAGGVATLIPERLSTFALGVTSEEQQSATYRAELYRTLVPQLPPFGKSEIVTFTSAGTRIGRFESTDSSFLYLGLNFGWIIVAMLLIPLLFIAFRLIAGTASIAEVGLFGQLPLLTTVALVTQYQSFLFFVAGFAAQMAVTATRHRHQDEERSIS
jgi:hypothetical protein